MLTIRSRMMAFLLFLSFCGFSQTNDTIKKTKRELHKERLKKHRQDFFSYKKKKSKKIYAKYAAKPLPPHNMPFDQHEHIIYLNGGGTGRLYHSYGYEYRYNFKPWGRFQIGTGFAAFSLFKTQEYLLSPSLSLQFGKKWFWIETGVEASVNLYSKGPNFTVSSFDAIAPKIGLHFKLGRVIELGANFLLVYSNRRTLKEIKSFGLTKGWFEGRIRFVIVSRGRRKALGPWWKKRNK